MLKDPKGLLCHGVKEIAVENVGDDLGHAATRDDHAHEFRGETIIRQVLVSYCIWTAYVEYFS